MNWGRRMNEDFGGSIDRQPTLQTITWLLNLRKFDQLNLDPPYQRKSVWSLREKQRFLDTILRNYPSPAIFLHLTYDNDGNATYHVVDGKQRLSTILGFVDGRIRIAKDFGDSRIDGVNWKGLEPYPAVRKSFWTYQLTVELLDDVHEPLVREIFSRLNRNSRKLEPQEIRHAKFEGWLISYLETQAQLELWKQLKISTRAREKRMADVQLLSEFAQVLIEGAVSGFDQESLDRLYADYEDPAETAADFDPEEFAARFERIALFLLEMDQHNGCVSNIAGSRNHLYSLWGNLALSKDGEIDPAAIADRYTAFLGEVDAVKKADLAEPNRDRSGDDPDVLRYLQASVGATTEMPQRLARHESLASFLSRE